MSCNVFKDLEAKQKNVEIVLVLINLVEISKDSLIFIFISIFIKNH